jgi:peptidoglycan/LPS O-acetylase OafA/YrhL
VIALAAATAALGATKLALDAAGLSDFSATFEMGPVRIGGEFLTGCLLWRAFSLGAIRRAPWGAISVAAFGVAGFVATRGQPAFAIVLCFAIGVFALAHTRGPLAYFLSLRPIVFLGEISYSIYLLHWVALRVFEYSIGRAVMEVGGLGLSLVVVLAGILGASVLTYYGVERPARRYLRGRFANPGDA